MKKWTKLFMLTLLVSLLALPVMADESDDDAKHNRRQGMTKAMVESLKAELELSDFQVEQVTKAFEKHQKKLEGMRNKFKELNDGLVKTIGKELDQDQKAKLEPALRKAKMSGMKQRAGNFNPGKMIEFVIKQLNITEAQQKQIKELLKEKICDAIDQWKTWANMPAEERMEKIGELKKEMMARMKEILTPEQIEKMEALKKQFGRFGKVGGPGFGKRPKHMGPEKSFGKRGDRSSGRMMGKDLNLTEDQKQQIKAIHEKHRAEIKTIREKIREEIKNNVLTEEQRKKLEEQHKDK